MIVVNHFPLPDVVFETNVTNDVREHKLGLYESWGVLTLPPVRSASPIATPEPPWLNRPHNRPKHGDNGALRLPSRSEVRRGDGRYEGPYEYWDDADSEVASMLRDVRPRHELWAEAPDAARNIPVDGRWDDETEPIAAVPPEAIREAGLECTDPDDFLRCLQWSADQREASGPPDAHEPGHATGCTSTFHALDALIAMGRVVAQLVDRAR